MIIALLAAFPLRAQNNSAQKHDEKAEQPPAPSATFNSQPSPAPEQNSTKSQQIDSLCKRLSDALILNWPLVAIGIATLFVIAYQAGEMAKATVAMQGSTKATENSVRLQEVAMRQWVNLEDLKVRAQPTFFTGISATTLVFTFNIINPTKIPLTIEWLIVRVSGERHDMSFHHYLAPDDVYPITVPVPIRDQQILEYGAYKLALSFITTVGYTDAFEKSQRQPFGVMCLCGPPAMCNVSPYEGTLPDDVLEKQQKNAN